jgi:hypothetical protein
MVSPDIKTMKMKIENKRQYTDGAAREKANPVADGCRTFRNTAMEDIAVVKMKGTFKGIGISNNARDEDGKDKKYIIFFIHNSEHPHGYHLHDTKNIFL